MHPEWEALAEEMTEEDPPLLLADVDAAAAADVAARFAVPSLPHYLLLRGRKMYNKRGTVGLDELRHWAVQGWAGDLEGEVPPEQAGGGGASGFDPLAAVQGAVGAVHARFYALLEAARSKVSFGVFYSQFWGDRFGLSWLTGFRFCAG